MTELEKKIWNGYIHARERQMDLEYRPRTHEYRERTGKVNGYKEILAYMGYDDNTLREVDKVIKAKQENEWAARTRCREAQMNYQKAKKEFDEATTEYQKFKTQIEIQELQALIIHPGLVILAEGGN